MGGGGGEEKEIDINNGDSNFCDEFVSFDGDYVILVMSLIIDTVEFYGGYL